MVWASVQGDNQRACLWTIARTEAQTIYIISYYTSMYLHFVNCEIICTMNWNITRFLQIVTLAHDPPSSFCFHPIQRRAIYSVVYFP